MRRSRTVSPFACSTFSSPLRSAPGCPGTEGGNIKGGLGLTATCARFDLQRTERRSAQAVRASSRSGRPQRCSCTETDPSGRQRTCLAPAVWARIEKRLIKRGKREGPSGSTDHAEHLSAGKRTKAVQRTGAYTSDKREDAREDTTCVVRVAALELSLHCLSIVSVSVQRL